MRGASHRRGEGAFGAIVSIVILIVAGIALVKIVPLHIAGNAVYDAMSEQANFGGLKTFDKLAYEVYVPTTQKDPKSGVLAQFLAVRAQMEKLPRLCM